MIISTAKQHSDEWHIERARIITASKFSTIVTAATLKPSAQIKTVVRLAAAAKTFNVIDEFFEDYNMARGTALEPEARAAYSLLTGLDVVEVGLCMNDSQTAGASPDGLIYSDEELVGGLEIKCPKLNTHLATLDAGKMPASHRLQVQGGLWITGAQWWDFASYFPGLPMFIERIFPEPEVHAALEKAVQKFTDDLAVMCDRFKSLGEI